MSCPHMASTARTNACFEGKMLEAALVDAGLPISATPTAGQPLAYLGGPAPRSIFGHSPKIGCQACHD
jgi:hypothetical protein